MLAREHCDSLIAKYSRGAGLGAIVPLPGVAMAITAAEVKLVADIARAYGDPLDDREALKLVALSSAKNVSVRTVGTLAGAVPFVGWLARPALAAVTVRAVGTAAVRHFEARHPDAPMCPPPQPRS